MPLCNFEDTAKESAMKRNLQNNKPLSRKMMKTPLMKANVVLVLVLLKLAILSEVVAQINNDLFTIKPITKEEYQNGYKNNFNAGFVIDIQDSLLIEKAFNSISKTYTKDEILLASRELVTPRELTSFESYYPSLNTYLFFIQDYHYEKACFVSALTNKVLSSYRFLGAFGVMSKDGKWIGLARGDCDNYLQLEICEITDEYATSIFRFDYKHVDIHYNSKEDIPPMFWAYKNRVYISIREHGKTHVTYYSLEFND